MNKAKIIVTASLVTALSLGSTVSAANTTFDSDRWSNWLRDNIEVRTFQLQGRNETHNVQNDYTGRFSFDCLFGSEDESEEEQEKESEDEDKEQDEEQYEEEKQEDSSDGSEAAGVNSEEQNVFEKVNEERAEQGLESYELDEELSEVARMKSQDMVDNDYFDHESPTYGSPGEMVRSEGIRYTVIGENIAVAGNINTAHAQLMASSSHRSSILNRNYTHVGIGVVETERGGVMVTQLFGRR